MKYLHLVCYGCIAALLFPLLFPSAAYAYLDPAAGSSLIAIIAGGFTGLIVVFKFWKARLRAWFIQRRKANDLESEEAEPSDKDSPH